MATDLEKLLLELKSNDKKVFDSIGIYANLNKSQAKEIVRIIIDRVTGDEKSDILLLYAIDYILKKVGRIYIVLFSEVIVPLFRKNFLSAGEDTRRKLFSLRWTWNGVLSLATLVALDVEINKIDTGWPLSQSKEVSFFVNIIFFSFCVGTWIIFQIHKLFFWRPIPLSGNGNNKFLF